MKLPLKLLVPVVILAGGFFSMIGLLSLRSEPPKRNPAPRPKAVFTETVSLGTIPADIRALGRVVSAQPVELFSEVSGTLMEGEVPFKPAQSFRKGDLLLKIDDRQARYQLNSTKSELMTALAQVLPEIKIDFPDKFQKWQDYFSRIEFGSRVPDLPGADNHKIKLFLSRFNVYKMYYSVRDLEMVLGKHHFYAPFDGSILSTNMRIGSTARSGTLLGQILNLESLEVEVPVPVTDVDWIDRSQAVGLTLSGGAESYTGTIARSASTIDTRTQTVQLYVSVDVNDSKPLFEGSYLDVEIPGRVIENACEVPRRALYEDRFVYVINDGVFEYREVEIARMETDNAIVSGGLSNGDTLVTELLQGVAPGMPATSRNLET